MIITIDGPAAAGKGTLASTLAEKYNLAYFDTGMVYRAVGLEMLLADKKLDDTESATLLAQHLTDNGIIFFGNGLQSITVDKIHIGV